MAEIDFNFKDMKRWFKSKTIWFNALTIIVAVASYYGWTPDPDVTTGVAHFLVAIAPAVNLVLRFWTRKAIGPY
jgi:hypothetical protein